MTNKKTTKRALFASVLSLLLCVSMLIGSTFAWFTDTASTGVNKIQAGNLDVALEMYDEATKTWVSAEGKTLDFKKAADAPADEEILWEPGCTYELPQLRVVNNGDLYLKYMISITGIDGDAKLNEAIEWTYGDDMTELGKDYKTLAPKAYSETITIKGHMKEEAGNEYQGLSIDGISITVYATQVEAEYDSFNNTYDANAPLLEDEDGNILIGDAGALMTFAAKVNAGESYSGKTVKLTADIDLTGWNWTPINLWDTNGTDTLVIDGQGHTISSMNVAGASQLGFISKVNGAGLTIKNLTFDNASVTTSGSQAGVVIGYQYGIVTLENVTVSNSTVKTTAEKGIRLGGMIGHSVINDGAKITIKNSTVDNVTVEGYHNVAGMIGTLYNYDELTSNWSITDSTVKNSTFKNASMNEKHVSAVAVEGADYPHTYEASNEYFSGVTVEHCNGAKVEINNLAEFKAFRDNVNAGITYEGYTVVLTADIDLNNEQWLPIGGNDTPLSRETAYFAGFFDGQNHKISNLYIRGVKTNNDLGLFGSVGRDTSCGIANLTLENVDISGGNRIGALIGNMHNFSDKTSSITVKNITVTGDVKIAGTNTSIGGVIGQACNLQLDDVTISATEESYVKTVGSNTRVGGVVGEMNFGTENRTYSNITSNLDVIGDGSSAVGGVFGRTSSRDGIKLVNCTVSGDVKLVNCPATYNVGKFTPEHRRTSPVTYDNCTFSGTVSVTNAEGTEQTFTVTE